MKTFKQLVSEVKQTVKDYQAGVEHSQIASIPSNEKLKNPYFHAGYQKGMKKGSEALHPSNMAKAVKKKPRTQETPDAQ
jgi:hypothetical protein